jgi:hypothetical protein
MSLVCRFHPCMSVMFPSARLHSGLVSASGATGSVCLPVPAVLIGPVRAQERVYDQQADRHSKARHCTPFGSSSHPERRRKDQKLIQTRRFLGDERAFLGPLFLFFCALLGRPGTDERTYGASDGGTTRRVHSDATSRVRVSDAGAGSGRIPVPLCARESGL